MTLEILCLGILIILISTFGIMSTIDVLCLSPGSLSHNFEEKQSCSVRVSKVEEFIEIE
jgi:hypothetical protein